MLTFDRYLVRNFAHVFATCFIAMFGLLIVIDLLENIDEFIADNGSSGSAALVMNILQYYGYQSIFFIDRAGPSLMLISVVVVLILFQRSGELHPLLSAGVPMARVLLPLVGSSVMVSGLLVLNQEFCIPRVAHAAHGSRGGADTTELQVEPVYDYASRISINGRHLQPTTRTIDDAEFVLPAPTIVGAMETLKAKQAVHCAATRQHPAGWLLKNVTPAWTELELTEQGRKLVRPVAQSRDLFIVTAVTSDQLYRRNSSFTMLSSRELMQRIHSPAFGVMTSQRLVAHLHSRFVQPLLNVIAVCLVIPLMVRRESPGLVVDSALCALVLGVNFVVTQGSLYLGQVQLLPPDIAAWVPVVLGGSWAAWLSGLLRS